MLCSKVNSLRIIGRATIKKFAAVGDKAFFSCVINDGDKYARVAIPFFSRVRRIGDRVLNTPARKKRLRGTCFIIDRVNPCYFVKIDGCIYNILRIYNIDFVIFHKKCTLYLVINYFMSIKSILSELNRTITVR